MSSFKVGDLVRFRGDDVDYEVMYYGDDRSDLRRVGGNDPDILEVPVRLLEPAPERMRKGQVWIAEGSPDIFIVEIKGNLVIYASAGVVTLSQNDQSWIRENYTNMMK